MGIRNFKHKGLAELFIYGESGKIGTRYVKVAKHILSVLDMMVHPDSCKVFKGFHELKGRRKGTYSLHVNGNYCITFTWDGFEACNVNFEDYH